MQTTLAIAVKSHNRKSVIQKYKFNKETENPQHILDQKTDAVETNVPFKSYLPHIVFNKNLQKIEVLGDFVWPYTKRVKNIEYEIDHYFLDASFGEKLGFENSDSKNSDYKNSNSKIWEKFESSCYDGRSYSSVVFVENIGTIMVGGILDYKTLGDCLVVTSSKFSSSKSSSSKLSRTNPCVSKQLPELNQPRRQHSLLLQNNKLFTVGGITGMSHEIDAKTRRKEILLNSVEMLDLDELDEWVNLNPLLTKIRGGSFLDSEIGCLWFGWAGSEEKSEGVEVVQKNLLTSSNSTNLFPNRVFPQVFNQPSYDKASFTFKNQLISIGGGFSSSHCLFRVLNLKTFHETCIELKNPTIMHVSAKMTNLAVQFTEVQELNENYKNVNSKNGVRKPHQSQYQSHWYLFVAYILACSVTFYFSKFKNYGGSGYVRLNNK